METFTEYIHAELLILVPVLYIIGLGLKKTSLIADKLIPVVIGICGILLSAIYVFATAELSTWTDGLTASFTAITQGVLVAGASVFCNQVYKQMKSE